MVVVMCSMLVVVFGVMCFCVVMEIKMLDDEEIDLYTCTRSSF